MKNVRIILGIILIIGGIERIASLEIIPAILYILCGISLIPAIYEKSKLKNNKIIQIIIPMIFLAILGMNFQKETNNNGYNNYNSYSNYSNYKNELYTNTEIEKIINIESIKLDEDNIEIDIKETRDVLLKINPINADTTELKFNTTNSQIVEFYKNIEKSNEKFIYATIQPVTEGEVEVYVTSNGIESNSIKITIVDKERIENEKRMAEEKAQKEAEEMAAAEQRRKEMEKAAEEEQARKKAEEAAKQQQQQQVSTPVKTPTQQSTNSQNINNSRTVYITPTGKRYHYLSTCGGKNSRATTLSEAISRGLTPCQKCAQ